MIVSHIGPIFNSILIYSCMFPSNGSGETSVNVPSRRIFGLGLLYINSDTRRRIMERGEAIR